MELKKLRLAPYFTLNLVDKARNYIVNINAKNADPSRGNLSTSLFSTLLTNIVIPFRDIADISGEQKIFSQV